MTTEPTLFDTEPAGPPSFMLDTGRVAIADQPPELNRWALDHHHTTARIVARTIEVGGTDREAWLELVATVSGDPEPINACELAKAIYGKRLRRSR